MGDPRGFTKIKRKVSGYRPVEERVNDYSEVELRLSDEERRQQASRCMDCGVPFCHWACPISNVMPDFQDKLYRGDWKGAWLALVDRNPFPEFTGRVCPALCEASCVLAYGDDPVTIRQNELAIIEKAFALGFEEPRPPKRRNGKSIAIVGGGPAGLAAAYYLNRAGFQVTVYEGDHKLGGYLRYGIPDFKLDKSFIDRRLDLMEAEGVRFVVNARVGAAPYAFGVGGVDANIIDAKTLKAENDLVLLTIGARDARDLSVNGRSLTGIHQALDFLSQQNRSCAGERCADDELEAIAALGKRVVVIGGGDTGADCVGTAHRQGALRVTQIELLPKPPDHRPQSEPWPLWPKVLKTSSSHLEGCDRLWSVNTKEFIGRDAKVEAIRACRVDWREDDGKWSMKEIPGSDFEIGADLVLLAMGFTHVVQGGAVADLDLDLDERGNIRTAGTFHTSNPKVWAAGDARKGASLVVSAIADGRAAAEAIIASLGN